MSAKRQVKDTYMCDWEVLPDFDLGMTSDQDLSVNISNECNEQVNHHASS